MKLRILTLTLVIGIGCAVSAQEITSKTLSAFKFRSIGPALTSGRVADIAVEPGNRSTYYVAAASGGVWKTTNAGTTFKPIFDDQGSYSIGCITIAPSNPHNLWVGTGENNNQRSVAYGDGVYRSDDGGKTWKNMGLKESEHIGNIIVHPDNHNVVYVAAYGPLWSSGGDRGLYKTVDGGAHWERILDVSEHTGISEVAMSKHHPNLMFAAAHQRRRHVFTYISGGPESALYRTTDGGVTWDKVGGGFPKGDLGRISVACSPVDPDLVYAMVEGHGFYKSVDRGVSWTKQDDYYSSGNYYVEIIPHPTERDWVYSMDTYGKVSKDGGKTWNAIGNKSRHVDDHALFIDPIDPNYLLIGCDGGVYESYDAGSNWVFMPNLPITQFYRVSTDNDQPFYNVFGGTQDNFSMGGPSRTLNREGIRNQDWFLTKGGDGFETQVDPTDPNIIYAQSQYGYLVRYDKKSGERTDIRPYPDRDEKPWRWNWDAPLIISPHDHQTLYFAANKIFKSTNRGDAWEIISPDLSQQIDRNALEVMGKVWSVDAVAKNQSTSIYGNIVSLEESPLQPGLLYAGTDDGAIWVSQNDGTSWEQYTQFPGIPEHTYVQDLVADRYDPAVVYALFNNHKNGDFKPYILKSSNYGKSWNSIHSDLPERGSVYAMEQDHIRPDLFFVGTEFGVYTTLNGGDSWLKFSNGLPTIAIRDLEIQRSHSDLVLASFGRGFYVLDNYSALREISEETLQNDVYVFKPDTGLMYHPATPQVYRDKGFQGERFYLAENPPFGLTFHYYLNKDLNAPKPDRDKTPYPDASALRAEDRDMGTSLLVDILDSEGKLVRRMKGKTSKGMNAITWDFRVADGRISDTEKEAIWTDKGTAHMALPGTYKIQLFQARSNEITPLTEPVAFECTALNRASLPARDQLGVDSFFRDLRSLGRRVDVAKYRMEKAWEFYVMFRSEALHAGLSDNGLMGEFDAMRQLKFAADSLLNGDESLTKREFETLPGLEERVGYTAYYAWNSSSAITSTQRMNAEIVQEETVVLEKWVDEMEQKVARWKLMWDDMNRALIEPKK